MVHPASVGLGIYQLLITGTVEKCINFYLLKWSFCINVLKYAVEGTQLLIVLYAGCFPSEWGVVDFYEVNCCTA